MTCSSVLFLPLALLASPGAEASNSTPPEPSSTQPKPLLHAQADCWPVCWPSLGQTVSYQAKLDLLA